MSTTPAPAPTAIEAIPAFDARTLVGQDNTAQIILDGQVYTLRVTKNGKLILTK